jgi:2-keto-4-pentenoate hydratase
MTVMDQDAIIEAARLLVAARRTGVSLMALPAHAMPTTFAEAAAIQMATLRLLGEEVAAYKVAGITPDTAMWGAILRSRTKPSPAVFPAAMVPMLGVEPEVAFRLEVDIGPSHRSLSLSDFDRVTSILPTIEIVDTRFTRYENAPLLHRAADFMSNGGLVVGEAWADTQPANLAELEVTVEIDGAIAARTKGGHANGDPRLPALAFLQAPGRPDVIARGTIITAGSYAGLLRAAPGASVVVRFAGHDPITLTFATEPQP